MQITIPPRLENLRTRVNGLLDQYLSQRNVRRLAIASAVGMFLVVVFGMLVTLTGSGTGCGHSWPLCRGQFVPSHFAMQTAIEYNHRIGTPLETILVLVTAFGAWRLWQRIEVRVLAILMVLFLLAQAGLGAAVVLFREPPELLAIHFGVSLTAFAACALMAIFLYQLDGWDRLRDRAVPKGLRGLIFGNLVFMYVVVYLGAYMDHKGLSLGCPDWPTTCGLVWGGFEAGQGIIFAHRFCALLLILGIVAMLLWSRQHRQTRPDLYHGSQFALGFIILQALVGATVVFSRTSVLSEMAHGGTAELLFGTLCYLAMQALWRPAQARAAQPAPRVAQVTRGGATVAEARSGARGPRGAHVTTRPPRRSAPVAAKSGPKAARTLRTQKRAVPVRRG